MKNQWWLVGLLILTSNVSLASNFSAERLTQLRTIAPDAEQLIWVKATTTETRTKAQLWVYKDNIWQSSEEEFDVSVGRTGTVVAADKVEGDGKTPQGLYPIWDTLYGKPNSENETEFSSFFEIENPNDLKMKYITLTPDDIWIDDVRHPKYNQQYTLSQLRAEPRDLRLSNPRASYEILRRSDVQYDIFAVIGYNMNPIVVGKGSAIFLHIWKHDFAPTAGCVATTADKMKEIARFLDPAKKPHILIGELP